MDLDYDVAVLAGDIVAPGRVAARWLRNPALDYRVGSCRVVSNPRGYVRWSGQNENQLFDPGLVVEL